MISLCHSTSIWLVAWTVSWQTALVDRSWLYNMYNVCGMLMSLPMGISEMTMSLWRLLSLSPADPPRWACGCHSKMGRGELAKSFALQLPSLLAKRLQWVCENYGYVDLAAKWKLAERLCCDIPLPRGYKPGTCCVHPASPTGSYRTL